MNSLLRLSMIFAASVAVLRAGETLPLDEHLEPLRPFLGKTWRGVFQGGKPDQPTVDISRWERALNGKAVRIIHSINDGAYGGESLVRWDDQTKKVTYYYFTTAGFMTQGTLSFEDGKVIGSEKVSGSPNITDVKSTTELRADGSMLVKADYLKNGERTSGREVVYQEDSKAEVKFK